MFYTNPIDIAYCISRAFVMVGQLLNTMAMEDGKKPSKIISADESLDTIQAVIRANVFVYGFTIERILSKFDSDTMFPENFKCPCDSFIVAIGQMKE